MASAIAPLVAAETVRHPVLRKTLPRAYTTPAYPAAPVIPCRANPPAPAIAVSIFGKRTSGIRNWSNPARWWKPDHKLRHRWKKPTWKPRGRHSRSPQSKDAARGYSTAHARGHGTLRCTTQGKPHRNKKKLGREMAAGATASAGFPTYACINTVKGWNLPTITC